MHHNTIFGFKKYCLNYFNSSSVVLEIGPDKFPSSFQQICEGSFAKWDTIDMYVFGKN